MRNVHCFGGDDVRVGWLNCQHFRALLLSQSVEVTILYMSSSTLKTEAPVSSKRLVNIYEATTCHIPDNNIHKLHSYEYLRRKAYSMRRDAWCQRMYLKTLCTLELEQVPFMVVTQGKIRLNTAGWGWLFTKHLRKFRT